MVPLNLLVLLGEIHLNLNSNPFEVNLYPLARHLRMATWKLFIQMAPEKLLRPINLKSDTFIEMATLELLDPMGQ